MFSELKWLLPNRTDYKIGITQKNQTSKISFFDSLGRNIASGRLDCLRNRQIDPPLIIGEYPKEFRFLLKRVRGISLFLYVDALLQKKPSEDFTP